MCRNVSLSLDLHSLLVDVWESNLSRFKLMILTGTAAYIGPAFSPGWRTLVAANRNAAFTIDYCFSAQGWS